MLAHLKALLERSSADRAASSAAIELYDGIVAAARDPALYLHGGVKDSVDGRFDSLALHAFLVMQRMSGEEGWDRVGGALADRIVADMDQSLREMGIGDMSIGKKVKAAASQLYGRFDNYWGAWAVEGEAERTAALSDVLARNLYRDGDPSPDTLHRAVAYMGEQRAFLAEIDSNDILAGRVRFKAAAQTTLGREGT